MPIHLFGFPDATVPPTRRARRHPGGIVVLTACGSLAVVSAGRPAWAQVPQTLNGPPVQVVPYVPEPGVPLITITPGTPNPFPGDGGTGTGTGTGTGGGTGSGDGSNVGSSEPLNCVFRRIPAGHSDANQPVIPTEASHRFRGIPATPEVGLARQFASSRPPTVRSLSSDSGERHARPETANASGSRSPPPQTCLRP